MPDPLPAFGHRVLRPHGLGARQVRSQGAHGEDRYRPQGDGSCPHGLCGHRHGHHNVAREMALGAGLPQSVPAHTCTLACVSANVAVTNGANLIATGNADIVIAGGVDTCSDAAIKVSSNVPQLHPGHDHVPPAQGLCRVLKRLKNMSPLDFCLPERPAVAEYSHRPPHGPDRGEASQEAWA